MARKKKTETKRPIESYEHRDKQRVNNPPVGLVTPETDPDAGAKKAYAYDPHLDPQLQWAGKAEHTSFEVPTVSLHVHERIDPRTIIEAVRKCSAGVSPVSPAGKAAGTAAPQLPLFETERKEPLRNVIEFYQHKHGWSNRLVAGDSLLVMNSLLEKEGMAGKVQMVYIDPPYGIRYGSNFQPFVNKRDVKDGKDEDLTQEPEQIRAFRDTWELGIHSYLTYLRDRLLLARELLTESGSVFVQMGDENVHHVRELMDEVFGKQNFIRMIAYTTQAAKEASKYIGNIFDFVIWYGKDATRTKYHQLYKGKELGEGIKQYNWVLTRYGEKRQLTNEEVSNLENGILPAGSKMFRLSDICSQGSSEIEQSFEIGGKVYHPRVGTHWSTNLEGLKVLLLADRIMIRGSFPQFIRFLDDYPVTPYSNVWNDLGGATNKVYAVQTSDRVIQRCLLMTTDPGDLVFDPTCGSGTTAYVAEQWGRRWITCDTSRVALTLARQRLMTAVFDYYELAHPEEGVGSGFKYKTVPHVTLKSIANNPEIDGIHARWQGRLEPIREQLNVVLGEQGIVDSGSKEAFKPLEEWEIPRERPDHWPLATDHLLQQWWDLRRKRQAEIDAAIARHAPQETLYDQPFVDRKKVRVTGPFTVEAVPAPAVKSVEEIVAQASSPASKEEKAAATAALRSGWHDRGYLPHLKREGGTYFVTFRLADTLPKEVLERYQFEREDIIKRAEAMGRELSPDEVKRLAELYSERIEHYLDAGQGNCWLKMPEIGNMVADALRHFDGSRYVLHAWVVMPNHVHVVVTPRNDYTLSKILHSWKSFTAHEVQKVAQASRLQIPQGEAFWQRESYDHLVRDEEDFARLCEYTIQNPVKAGLCERPEDWPFSSASAASASRIEKMLIAGEPPALLADASIARSGETLRQAEWRDELLKTGIRGKNGQRIRFTRLEPLPGCRWLHADGETRPSDEGADCVREDAPAYNPMRVVVSFGPEHAPLEQRQVAQAIEEAQTLVPKPKLIVFAAFQFDPEAAKDIDETNWPGVTLLKVQMNADLLTDDLKKKRASNESFWLIGQPDVEIRRQSNGKYVVEVHGFDYYNTKTGQIESGGEDKIAVWLLDTDYDGRSLYPRQVFFPMAGENEGWARLARNLKAEIDEERIEAYRGTVSLPFEAGEHKRIAVKIVDDRGIESLKVLEVE